MSLLTIIIDWIHLTGMSIWIGGMVFINFVFYKVIDVLDPEDRGKVMVAMTSAYSKLTTPAITLLILTGFFNTFDGGFVFSDSTLSSTYQMVLGIKMMFVAAMLYFALSISMRLGPKATSLAPKQGEKPDPEFLAIQEKIVKFGRINMHLGIGLLLLASFLINGAKF